MPYCVGGPDCNCPDDDEDDDEKDRDDFREPDQDDWVGVGSPWPNDPIPNEP